MAERNPVRLSGIPPLPGGGLLTTCRPIPCLTGSNEDVMAENPACSQKVLDGGEE